MTAGEVLPAPPAAGRFQRPGGSAFDQFLARLTDYPAPRPSRQLGEAAAKGAAMTTGAGLLLTMLPSPEHVARWEIYHWVGNRFASRLDEIGALGLPVLLLGLACAGLSAFAWFGARGARPVLNWFTIQPWLGVGTLALAGLPWLAIIGLALVNIAIYVVIGAAIIAGACLLLGLLAAG